MKPSLANSGLMQIKTQVPGAVIAAAGGPFFVPCRGLCFLHLHPGSVKLILDDPELGYT